MDEIEVGGFKSQKNQFLFGKRKQQAATNKAAKIQKTEISNKMASAEEKFDALFSTPASRKYIVYS